MNILETMKQALEALFLRRNQGKSETYNSMAEEAITALRAAIDEMEKVEPAIWRIDTHDAFWFQDQPDDSEREDITSTPLFAHPDNSELRAAIAEMEKVEPFAFAMTHEMSPSGWNFVKNRGQEIKTDKFCGPLIPLYDLRGIKE